MPTVAILVEKTFEDNELHYPRLRLVEAGFDVKLVAPEAGETYHGKYGTPAKTDVASADARASDFSVIVVPGGFSPDHMRRDRHLVRLVRDAARQNVPMAAICHGPWMLATADAVRGRRVTSFMSIADDLRHAGATWVDEETVVDGPLVTARTPDDLPSFMKAVLALLRDGRAQGVVGRPIAPDWVTNPS